MQGQELTLKEVEEYTVARRQDENPENNARHSETPITPAHLEECSGPILHHDANDLLLHSSLMEGLSLH